MKKSILTLLIAAGALAAAQSASAAVAMYSISGASCIPVKNTPTRISTYGIDYFGSGGQGGNNGVGSISCPFTIDASNRATAVQLAIHGYDRHPVTNLACTLTVTNASGGVLAQQTAAFPVAISEAQQNGFAYIPNIPSPLSARYYTVGCALPYERAPAVAGLSTISHLTALDLTVWY
jgi:hypothetical protein